MTEPAALLDLLSTSQKVIHASVNFDGQLSPVDQRDIARLKHISKRQQDHRCAKHAPFICYRIDSVKWGLSQGCCNDWTCPRCGHIRARIEYGRIVEGAQTLFDDGHTLYFWTITCRGRELSLPDALANYMLWTNRLLTACRAKCKRDGGFWCYMQVTEHQERGHPHSHFLTTFVPGDVRPFVTGDHLPNGAVAKHDGLWSDWFHDRNVSAGLGPMCDLSQVNHPLAVAVYLSKYLFKELIYTEWPKGWKRIRYSQNWPKTAMSQEESDAFVVLTLADWRKVDNMHYVQAQDMAVYHAALARQCASIMPPSSRQAVDAHINLVQTRA